MTKMFIVIFGEEKTWQKPQCASLALELGSSGVRIQSSRSHSSGVTCGTAPAVLAPACPQPAHTTAAPSWATAPQLQLQRGDAHGGRGN